MWRLQRENLPVSDMADSIAACCAWLSRPVPAAPERALPTLLGPLLYVFTGQSLDLRCGFTNDSQQFLIGCVIQVAEAYFFALHEHAQVLRQIGQCALLVVKLDLQALFAFSYFSDRGSRMVINER